MNTITKKYLVGIGVGIVVLGSACALAFAAYSHPIVVQIGSNGNILLRGTIDAVATNALTVKSWGGEWTVNISSSTHLTPGNSISQFKAGDFVGVQGSISKTASWTVDATVVRDWTVGQNAQIHTINDQVPVSRTGTVESKNTSNNSFTFISAGKKYTVYVTTGAKIGDNLNDFC